MENTVFKYEPIRIEAVGEEGFRVDPPPPKFETFRIKHFRFRKVFVRLTIRVQDVALGHFDSDLLSLYIL